jgi:CRP-like cAMP-binding protein
MAFMHHGFDPLLSSPLAALLDRNTLLAALPADIRARLLPHLGLVDLPAGRTLVEPGSQLPRALFPLSGVVSLIQEMPDGDGGQVAVVGNEGLLGLPLFMGGHTMPMRAVVHCAGQGLALGRDRLVEEFEQGGGFMRQLLRYTQALITQISQLVVCNRHHSIEQQLCRVVLMTSERLGVPQVPLTQEFAARLLGVRREGVTEASGRLREAGAVACRRGIFEVLDRDVLERRACGCYGVVSGEYLRLLPSASQAGSAPAMPQRSPRYRPVPPPAEGWRAIANPA